MVEYYQSLIGILHWIVELGKVDIACEVSMMLSCLALPREGHLQQLYHIFAYLSRSQFEKQDWSKTVYATGVDSDHAGCTITR